MTSPTRILIADADGASRAGISLALRGHGFELCAEADSADDAIACAIRERPELCLIETDLPGGGVEAVRAIQQQLPEAVLLMIGADVDDERLFDALGAGARGFVRKDMDPERLPATLRGALDGEAALPRAAVGRILDELSARERGRHATELARLGVELTRREREVLELLDEGLSTAAIATSLSISDVTVRRHTSSILGKLEVSDREAALRLLREPPG